MSQLSAKQKKYLADLSLLFVAFAWGGGFVAVKDALNSLTPMYLMAFRFTLASIVVYVSLHQWIGKITVKEFKNSSVVGTILFMAFAAQTVGLQYTTASKQGFLTATYVIMVPFLYWVLYQKRPPIKVFAGSFLTLVGIGFIGLDSTLSLNKGDWLTLLCALFFAMHILSIEFYTKTIHVFKVAFVQISVAAVWFIVAALILEPMPGALSSRAWIAIVYMAVVSTFGCFTVQTVAQKHTTSSHASIIMSLESVFAAVLGVWLLQEKMTIAMLFGCGLIFIAILMVEVNLKKSVPEPEALGLESD